VDARIPPPRTPEERRARSESIERENIALQIEHLKRYPLVKKALLEEKLQIHGLYYDIETGMLMEVT